MTREFRQYVARAVASYAIPAIGLAIGVAGTIGSHSAGSLPIALVIGAYIFSVPIQFIVGFESATRSWRLRSDLKADVVRRYEAERVDQTNVNGAGVEDILQKLSIPAGPGPISMEVLPRSNRLLTIGSVPVEKWVPARRTIFAVIPPIARMAAEWLQPWKRVGEDDLAKGQRDLSAAEKSELSAYARHVALRSLPATAVSGALALWMGNYGLTHSPGNFVQFGFSGLFVAMGMYVLYAKIRDLRWAQLLADDAKTGRVAIISWTRRAGNDSPYRIAEELPRSRWYWTVNGRVPEWRNVINTQVVDRNPRPFAY